LKKSACFSSWEDQSRCFEEIKQRCNLVDDVLKKFEKPKRTSSNLEVGTNWTKVFHKLLDLRSSAFNLCEGFPAPEILWGS
jgi:hypothetical protein